MTEHAGVVRVGVAIGHARLALLFDQRPPTGEQLHRSGDDPVQHRMQRFIGRRGHLDKQGLAFGTAPVHAVQHQAVQVNVQVGGRPDRESSAGSA